MSKKCSKEKCVGCYHEKACLEFFDQDVPGFLEKIKQMTPLELQDLSDHLEAKFPGLEKEHWAVAPMNKIQESASVSIGDAFAAFLEALKNDELPVLPALSTVFERVNRDDIMLFFLYFVLWDLGTHSLQENKGWDFEMAYAEAIANADLMSPGTVELYKWISARVTIYALSKVLDANRVMSEEARKRSHATIN